MTAIRPRKSDYPSSLKKCPICGKKKSNIVMVSQKRVKEDTEVVKGVARGEFRKARFMQKKQYICGKCAIKKNSGVWFDHNLDGSELTRLCKACHYII